MRTYLAAFDNINGDRDPLLRHHPIFRHGPGPQDEVVAHGLPAPPCLESYSAPAMIAVHAAAVRQNLVICQTVADGVHEDRLLVVPQQAHLAVLRCVAAHALPCLVRCAGQQCRLAACGNLVGGQGAQRTLRLRVSAASRGQHTTDPLHLSVSTHRRHIRA